MCLYLFLRSLVNAEAKEIWIFAAAHLQRSPGSTENVPLSPESKTRYRPETRRSVALTAFLFASSCFKIQEDVVSLSSLHQFTKPQRSVTARPAVPLSVHGRKQSFLRQRIEEDKVEKCPSFFRRCSRLTK